MNSPDQTSDVAWERILPQIRITRQKRITRKIATITALCAMFGIWLGIRPFHPSENPMDRPIVKNFHPPEVAPVTLAILRINQDGTARLEEVTIDELEEVELKFSLQPIITFGHFE